MPAIVASGFARSLAPGAGGPQTGASGLSSPPAATSPRRRMSPVSSATGYVGSLLPAARWSVPVGQGTAVRAVAMTLLPVSSPRLPGAPAGRGVRPALPQGLHLSLIHI
eukprot:7144441-Alexandrium_andersonii.AAC.1